MTTIEIVALVIGAVVGGAVIGMFIMAALAVGREENREADEDE